MSHFADYDITNNFPIMTCMANTLNVRSAPGTGAPIIYTMNKGEIFMYIPDERYDFINFHGTRIHNGYFWWRIKFFDFNSQAFRPGFIAYCSMTGDWTVNNAGGIGTVYAADHSSGGTAWRTMTAKIANNRYDAIQYSADGIGDVISKGVGYEFQTKTYQTLESHRGSLFPQGFMIRVPLSQGDPNGCTEATGGKVPIPAFICGMSYPERLYDIQSGSHPWMLWYPAGHYGSTRRDYPFSQKAFRFRGGAGASGPMFTYQNNSVVL